MRKLFVSTCVICLSSWFSVKAQLLNDVAISTKVLRSVVSYNPNVEIEKILGTQTSVSVDYIFHNRKLIYNGGEYGNEFRETSGNGLGIGFRYYLSSQKEAGKGVYLGLFSRYDAYHIKNLEVREPLTEPYKKVNRYYEGFQMSGLVGRKFFLGNFFTELNTGLGYRVGRREDKYVEFYENANKQQREEHYQYESLSRNRLILMMNWSVGYFFARQSEN